MPIAVAFTPRPSTTVPPAELEIEIAPPETWTVAAGIGPPGSSMTEPRICTGWEIERAEPSPIVLPRPPSKVGAKVIWSRSDASFASAIAARSVHSPKAVLQASFAAGSRCHRFR